MSNNHEPRRRFLRQMLAVVPVTSVATATALSESACGDAPSSGAVSSQGAAAPYAPQYFTEDEWRFIGAAVDRLIPADGLGAGALQAGVPEYIDKQMDTPYGHGKLWYMQGPFHPDSVPEMGYQINLSPREVYRHGIEACNAYCKQQHGGKVFAELDVATQEAVLHELEHGKPAFDSVPSKTFFATLLGNTKEGFLADPIYGGNQGMVGWKMVGFPGARADFMDWIDQPGVKYPYGPVSINGRRG
ncbi:gluconate 2-dehydrogenase subunit 3 family protein [Paraburkholderia sp. J94]|uniref:gluconate 2-dehydrogenase subunit 3 family protein n=1 Tax=Paraburkholderia sp. J94 TaxID=2805441 RepID=UPI002AB2D629|nr:gluconate 2-dehydrogenase subunit 3 family protein [Paraburkholderia sp. J94]